MMCRRLPVGYPNAFSVGEREEVKNEHQIQGTLVERFFGAHGFDNRASVRGRVEQGNQARVQRAGASSWESTRCREIRLQARC